MPFYKYSSLVYFYTSDGTVRSVRIKIAFKDSRKLNFFYLIFFFLLVTSKLLKCKQFQLQMMWRINGRWLSDMQLSALLGF